MLTRGGWYFIKIGKWEGVNKWKWVIFLTKKQEGSPTISFLYTLLMKANKFELN